MLGKSRPMQFGDSKNTHGIHSGWDYFNWLLLKEKQILSVFSNMYPFLQGFPISM